jgi:hypothetical protein
VGRGVGIPDTRSDLTVTVRKTSSSNPVEFVLTAEAGTAALAHLTGVSPVCRPGH